MGTYLVTGAAGFIGAHLARRLIAGGHRVVSIDNLSTGYAANIPQGTEFYHGHCQDEAMYSRIPEIKYDAIFHIAGQSSGEISFDDPVYDLETNTASTLHLLKFALKVQCHRFIYASSMSVYGDYLDGPVTEAVFLQPKSFYAIGKLASEQYLRLYEQYGVKSTALRFFNVYGPGQNMKNLRQGMVSIYLAQMLKYGMVTVRGDANRFRDFVYIEDVIDACLLCLSEVDSAGKVINIATGKKTTVAELVHRLIVLLDEKISVSYEGTTLGDTFGVYANMSLANKILGFYPKYQLDDGLINMIRWARSEMLVESI